MNVSWLAVGLLVVVGCSSGVDVMRPEGTPTCTTSIAPGSACVRGAASFHASGSTIVAMDRSRAVVLAVATRSADGVQVRQVGKPLANASVADFLASFPEGGLGVRVDGEHPVCDEAYAEIMYAEEIAQQWVEDLGLPQSYQLDLASAIRAGGMNVFTGFHCSM